jgi:hypothetical protein
MGSNPIPSAQRPRSASSPAWKRHDLPMAGDIVWTVASAIVLVLVIGSLFVGWKVRPSPGTLRDARRARTEPRSSAMQPALGCPFCGHEMRPGRVANRSGGLYPVVWEPMEAPPRGRLVNPHKVAGPEKLVIGPSHQATRGASICDACAAVVIDPGHGAGRSPVEGQVAADVTE